jgi:hypothetical protein
MKTEVIKKEGSALLKEITKNFCEEKLDQCLQNIGNLETNLNNAYKTMEEQNERLRPTGNTLIAVANPCDKNVCMICQYYC